MRKLVSVLLAVGIVGGMLAGVASAHRPAERYLALGDSLAAGVGAPNQAHTGYVPRFFNNYLRSGTAGPNSLTNLAVSGETSTTYLASGQHQAAINAINEADDVTIVTLDIGGNDFLDLMNPGGPCVNPADPGCLPAVQGALGQLAINMSAIIPDTAAALATDPGDERFVVLTYYNPFGGSGHPMEALIDQILLGTDVVVDCDAAGVPGAWGANDIIACIATPFGSEVVDTYEPFGDDTYAVYTHMSEGQNDFHPTNAGHKLIADLIGAGQ